MRIILDGSFSCTDLKLFTTLNRKQSDPCLMNGGHHSEDHFINYAVAYELWEPRRFIFLPLYRIQIACKCPFPHCFLPHC